MLIKKTFAALATASTVLLLGSGLVLAQTTRDGMTIATNTSPEGAKLALSYSSFAGSPENAQSLVNGLRTGTSITLGPSLTGPNATAPSASISPATGKMGYGSVNTAIALAKTSLAQQNISNPTPAQLSAALGSVLEQRSQGLGWGQIAKGMGVTLGSVESASHTDKNGKSDHPGKDSGDSGKGSNAAGNGGGNAGGHGGGGGGGGGGGNGGGGGGGKK